ncbi:MAG: hypothetical protein Q7T55_23980 [Solirubrobacteraceae bacterium]|nr:hypothetical protein [Solirubrobacteraceae bacterium]
MLAPRRLGNLLFVAALTLSAVAVFVYLHSGGRGERFCNSMGSSGPGTLSIWLPGTRCWVGDASAQPQVMVSGLFPFALFGAWAPITGLYLLARRRRQLPASDDW